MSIFVPLSKLNQSLSAKYAKDLQFEKKQNPKFPSKPVTIECYDLVKNSEGVSCVSIPYSYARSEHWEPPSYASFASNHAEFLWSLRSEQVPVAERALHVLTHKGSVLLALRCGFGKSPLALFLGIQTGLKCLIITPSLRLLIEQWSELIESATNGKLQVLTTQTKEIDTSCDFYLCSASTFVKLSSKNVSFDFIGTVLFDELHMLCSQQNIKALSRIQARYQIGLSATPSRIDGLDAAIPLYFGTEWLEVPLNETHYVIPIYTQCTYEWQSWHDLLEQQANHSMRNDCIFDLLKQCKKYTRTVLVLCKRIDQINHLSNRLENEQIKHQVLTAHSNQIDPSTDLIIGTVQKCGVGFSYNKLDTLIVAADVEASFLQFLGRVFRRPDVLPIIFDLVDQTATLQKHYKTRRKIYQNAGGHICKPTDFNEVQNTDVLSVLFHPSQSFEKN